MDGIKEREGLLELERYEDPEKNGCAVKCSANLLLQEKIEELSSGRTRDRS
jgi:hypothetical protein